MLKEAGENIADWAWFPMGAFNSSWALVHAYKVTAGSSLEMFLCVLVYPTLQEWKLPFLVWLYFRWYSVWRVAWSNNMLLFCVELWFNEMGGAAVCLPVPPSTGSSRLSTNLTSRNSTSFLLQAGNGLAFQWRLRGCALAIWCHGMHELQFPPALRR